MSEEEPDQVQVRPRGPGTSLERSLGQLRSAIADAKPVPLSSSVMVNRAEVEGLLADVESALPEDLREARWVVKERDEVLEAAQAESHRILEEARAERARLIARTEVVQAANLEAERIVEDARERGRAIRLQAEDYVDAKLANFEVVLNKVLSSVEKGREKLRGRLDTGQLVENLVDDED